MARRSRNRSFLPLIIRVIAIIAIGLVVYRYVGPQGSVSPEIPIATGERDNNLLADGTTTQTTGAIGTDVLAASSDTSPAKTSSGWTISSMLGFGNSEEPVTTLKPSTDAKIQTVAVTSPPSDPQSDTRNPFSNASTPSNANRAISKAADTFNAAKQRTSNAARVLQAPNDGRTAQNIFAATRAAYQRLTTYSDEGKIALTYRHNGELKAEPHAFSTTWDARNSLYAGNLFSTEVRCDRKLLSCYMYDNDSENFGNQQLIIPVPTSSSAPPIVGLLNDPFARAFVAGTENIPLVAPQSATGMFAMPPALAMLSNQVSSPWLSNGTQLKRLPDQTIQNVNCYVLESTPGQSSQDSATLWIDKKTSLVKQIKFPNSLVLAKIRNASQVTDLELMASFPNQKTNVPLRSEQFVVKKYKNAQPVKKFIRLPDSMVSDSIGKSASIARFIKRDGDPVSADDFKAKVNTIVWLGDERNIGLVDQLAQFKKTSPQTFGFHAVFTGRLADTRTEVPKPVASLRLKERLGIPLLFDDGSALEALQVKSMPALLVLGSDGRVQYSQNLSDPQWPQSLQSVLQRLARGEDIAKEMLADYRVHYQEYGDELERYSANSFFASSKEPVVTTVDRGERDTSIKLTPNKKWEQQNFALPGNVLALSQRAGQSFGNARHAVFDGGQTVKFIDSQGTATGKIVLEIPGNPAIRVLRHNPAGKGTYTGFERMGAQVHVFDSNLQLLRSFPNPEQKHAGILDCQPVPGADGKYLISFNDSNGVYLFDVNTGKPEKMSDQIVSAIATSSTGGDSQLIGVVDGQLFDLMAREAINDLSGKQVHRLLQSATNNGTYGATVRSASNAWSAIGLSKQLKQIWSVDLRSQLLENPVEPIAVAQNSNGETFWAVVDDDNTVCLISGRGTWLGDWKSESPIRGIAISTSGREVDLIVSTEESVVAWALNYQAR